MSNQKITIRDVAAAAGVSSAVVSRVINNAASVKPETFKMVSKVIKRLDYTPDTRGRGANPSARARKKRRTNRIVFLKIGVIGSYTPPIYAELINEVEERLAEHKQNLILKKVTSDTEIIEALSGISFDGIIINGIVKHNKAIQFLRQFPCVRVMGLFEPDSFWDHVTYDNWAIGQAAAKHLLQKGHTCCGILRYDKESNMFLQRAESFQQVVENAGGKVFDLPIETTTEGWRYPVDKIINNLNNMTTIFSVADVLTIFLYPQLKEQGIQLEKSLEFVSCNNEWPRIEPLFPKPSEIDLNIQQIAQKGVQQLLWRINNPLQAREKISVDVKLVTSEELEQRIPIYQYSTSVEA